MAFVKNDGLSHKTAKMAAMAKADKTESCYYGSVVKLQKWLLYPRLRRPRAAMA